MAVDGLCQHFVDLEIYRYLNSGTPLKLLVYGYKTMFKSTRHAGEYVYQSDIFTVWESKPRQVANVKLTVYRRITKPRGTYTKFKPRLGIVELPNKEWQAQIKLLEYQSNVYDSQILACADYDLKVIESRLFRQLNFMSGFTSNMLSVILCFLSFRTPNNMYKYKQSVRMAEEAGHSRLASDMKTVGYVIPDACVNNVPYLQLLSFVVIAEIPKKSYKYCEEIKCNDVTVSLNAAATSDGIFARVTEFQIHFVV